MASDVCSSVAYLPDPSDRGLHFTVNVPVKHHRNHTKYIRDYRAADFDGINCDLCVFMKEILQGFSERSVNTNWKLFRDKAASLTEAFVPLRKVMSNKHVRWFNHLLKRLVNKKKQMVRSAKAFNSPSCWEIYHSVNVEHKEINKIGKGQIFK